MDDKINRLLETIKKINYSNIIENLEGRIHKLEYLTGKSIDELIDLFAAGWTLTPPDPPDYNAMTKLAMEMEENKE